MILYRKPQWDSDEITWEAWEEYHGRQRKNYYLEAVRFLDDMNASNRRIHSFLAKYKAPKKNLTTIDIKISTAIITKKIKNLCSEMEKYPVI